VVESIADRARPVWFAFTELFAFCDLHASRWQERRQAVFNNLWFAGALPMYYDRQGFPIPADPDEGCPEPGWMLPVLQWAKLNQDREYSRVAYDDLPDGSYLSTVWLGLDHNHGLGPPLIFETMRFAGAVSEATLPRPFGDGESTMTYHESLEFPNIFDAEGGTTEQLRYTTEEEALAAHHEIVRRIVLATGH
jgi:hypothetical protein